MKAVNALLAILLLTSCSPKVQPYDMAADEPPRIESGSFHSADQAELFSRSWLPESKPKAVIIALHGMNDYSHSFEGSGTFFRKHGIAVYAYDQRGFGRSPDRGIWGGVDNYTNDLKQYVTALKQHYPHKPIYILGESMGGAVAITALSDPTFPPVKGVILSAPAVWGAETIPVLYRGTLWLVAHTFPSKLFTGSSLKIIASDNYPMLRALSTDPLVIKSTRVDAVYGMVHIMDSAYEKIPDLKTPTLLLYGAHDQVIPQHPIEKALQRFTIPIQYAYYPQGYHMLLRDLEAQLVMRDILSWIEHPNRKLPSGLGEVMKPER